jgi:hypothetical protein
VKSDCFLVKRLESGYILYATMLPKTDKASLQI